MHENNEIRVVDWDGPFENVKEREHAFFVSGGWVDGHSWSEYLEHMLASDDAGPGSLPYLEALRREVLSRRLFISGEDHQDWRFGTPVFSDGKVANFTWRAWGDFMAAVWSEAFQGLGYMQFYMSGPPSWAPRQDYDVSPSVRPKMSVDDFGDLETNRGEQARSHLRWTKVSRTRADLEKQFRSEHGRQPNFGEQMALMHKAEVRVATEQK